MVIKERTENLLDKNKLLQLKSGELHQVLETSQKQLQSQITIPIELINELAEEVKQMKDDQQTRFEKLLKSLEEVHEKFNKQKCLATENMESKIEQNKINGHPEPSCNEVVAWAKSGSNTKVDSSSSISSHHLTILDNCDTNGSESLHPNDPASHSEVIVPKEPDNILVKESIKEEKKVENTIDGTIHTKGKSHFD